MLEGANIVLQGTAFDGATSLAMASAPGVMFWEQQLASIRLRSQAGALVEDVPRLTSPLWTCWQRHSTWEMISGVAVWVFIQWMVLLYGSGAKAPGSAPAF